MGGRAINVNECRIPLGDETKRGGFGGAKMGYADGEVGKSKKEFKAEWIEKRDGRYPANLILDEESSKLIDKEFGETQSSKTRSSGGFGASKHTFKCDDKRTINYERGYSDSGGVSRFFYTSKALKKERNRGLELLDITNDHPTVKPLDLMKYLIKLVTPPDGVVLDPFLGSGSTACVAEILDVDWIGIEIKEKYIKIAENRIEYWGKSKVGKAKYKKKIEEDSEASKQSKKILGVMYDEE